MIVLILKQGAGVCIGYVVGNVVRAATPVGIGIGGKIATAVGAYLIGHWIGTEAIATIEKDILESIKEYKKLKKESEN